MLTVVMSLNDLSIGSHAKFKTIILDEQMRTLKLHVGEEREITVART